MAGLVVIGPAADAVARAVDGDAWVLDEGPGTPAITAEHAGRELSAATLRAAAQSAPIAAVRHNPVAPLTSRYTARDLAAELGVPVVIAVDAEPGLSGRARVYGEAIRSAGVPLAAFVIAGWPDPPSRVLLDERVLLHEVTGVPVFTLSGAEAPDWPVDEWQDAMAAGARGSVPPQRLALEPYQAWDGEVPGDPRSVPRPRLMDALCEIVAAEGPMLASRAYALYNRAAGGKKPTSVARAPLSNSVSHLAREGRLALERSEDVPWQGDDVVRSPGSPPVVVRELGPRELVEVPLDEIAELMRRLQHVGIGPHPPDLRRAVLDTYGLVRMTARAEQYLTTAQELLGEGQAAR